MRVKIIFKEIEEPCILDCDNTGVDIGGEWLACEENGQPILLVPRENILYVETFPDEEEEESQEENSEGHTLQ